LQRFCGQSGDLWNLSRALQFVHQFSYFVAHGRAFARSVNITKRITYPNPIGTDDLPYVISNSFSFRITLCDPNRCSDVL
jgi:hypothetical protein